jgi:Zn-dependent protease
MSLGKWFGIPVNLHWSWFLFLGIIACFDPNSVTIIVGVFGIVLLHELGHCLASEYCHQKAKHITIYPFGGAAYMDIPVEPWKEFLITVAGPLVNLLLIPVIGYFAADNAYLTRLDACNKVILVFNLLPIFPMDGGRLLRSALSAMLKNRVLATKIAVRVGQVGCVALVGVGIYFIMPMLAVIGVLTALVAESELKTVLDEPSTGDTSRDDIIRIQKRLQAVKWQIQEFEQKSGEDSGGKSN